MVQRCTWRMDKARKIAMEATAMADQLEGDLCAAQRALEALNGNGATGATGDTKKGAVPIDEVKDEAERELAIEREMMEEAAEAADKAYEQEHPLTDAEEEAENESSQAGGTLSGYPDDGTTPANRSFEALLKAGTLRLKLVDRPGYASDQAIEPGPNGRNNDVFQNKDLFKQCTPRFVFNGEAKQWRRTAPHGWTGQPTAAA